MSDITDAMKLELQARAQIPNMPTDLTYKCRMAIEGEGPRAYDWSDKPHRLVFDLCREVERLTAERDNATREALEAAAKVADGLDPNATDIGAAIRAMKGETA